MIVAPSDTTSGSASAPSKAPATCSMNMPARGQTRWKICKASWWQVRTSSTLLMALPAQTAMTLNVKQHVLTTTSSPKALFRAFTSSKKSWSRNILAFLYFLFCLFIGFCLFCIYTSFLGQMLVNLEMKRHVNLTKHIYIYLFFKRREQGPYSTWENREFLSIYTYIFTSIYTYLFTYIYLYIMFCVEGNDDIIVKVWRFWSARAVITLGII